MLRKLFFYTILSATGLWLIFSYVPESVIALPDFAVPAASVRETFQTLLVVFFVAFLLLQFWLLRATRQIFRVPANDAESSPTLMGLSLSAELFWTAVPIAMTIALALLSYGTWRALVHSGTV